MLSTMLNPLQESDAWAHPAATYMQIRVICTYYVILYKGLEHPWIWVSLGGLKTNPLWILRDSYI